MQRGVLEKNACEGIVHELLDDYSNGHTILSVDYTNAYNTAQLSAIAQSLQAHKVFKPFMRMFYCEYGNPSDHG